MGQKLGANEWRLTYADAHDGAIKVKPTLDAADERLRNFSAGKDLKTRPIEAGLLFALNLRKGGLKAEIKCDTMDAAASRFRPTGWPDKSALNKEMKIYEY